MAGHFSLWRPFAMAGRYQGRLYLPKATEGCRRLPKADVSDVVRHRQGWIQGEGLVGFGRTPFPSETQMYGKPFSHLIDVGRYLQLNTDIYN